MTNGVTSRLTDEAVAELRWAHKHLEHPSFAARLSDLLASPFEEAIALLPKTWKRRVDRTAEASIGRALNLALMSMRYGVQGPSSNWAHKVLVAGAGAAGGFFGPLTVLAELPITTTLMLRSIADIARSEGEDLREAETRLACFQVFALGGRTRDDERAEIGYYGLRITLGLHFENILEFAGAAEGIHIPAFIDLVRSVAARFGVVITDAAAVKMIPIAGAVSGAALNLIFTQHYQDVARGHFIVRRLEREYGMEMIRREYQRLEGEESEAEREYSPLEGF
ncbi:MAG: EcsC family protein [Pseudomonadota bacterium]|nr:EcsC family protein [Pseudomonadota bacterium]